MGYKGEWINLRAGLEGFYCLCRLKAPTLSSLLTGS